MLKKYQEQDFLLLRDIALDRLFPSNISVGLMGVLIYSAVMNAILLFARWQSPNINHPIWDYVVPVSIGTFIIQAGITLYFFNEERAFAYQNFQSIFLCLVTLKMSVEGYLLFFLMYVDRLAPTYVAQLGVTIIIGGLIYLLISIIRAIKRVNDGHFREGGKGILNFSQSKAYVSLPVIFGITMIGGVISRLLNNSTDPLSSNIEIYFILFLVAIIQYGIALIWSEFLLLAYCKRRFKSFIIERPERIDM